MFQFPANPTSGQLFTPVAGVTYKWNGTAWFLVTHPEGGLTGPQGPEGPVGPEGPQGPAGTSVAASVIVADTLPPAMPQGRQWFESDSGVLLMKYVNPDATETMVASAPAGGFFIPYAERAAANGVATLDAGIKVPVAQIPDLSGVYRTLTNLTFASPTFHANGTTANPSVSWTSEPTSGWYRRLSQTFDFSIAGADRFEVSNVGATVYGTLTANATSVNGALGVTGQAQFADGTSANPSIVWASDPTSGWWKSFNYGRRYSVGGTIREQLYALSTSTTFGLYPPASDPERSVYFSIYSNPEGSASGQRTLQLASTMSGLFMAETVSGSETSKPMTFSFPSGVTINSSPFQPGLNDDAALVLSGGFGGGLVLRDGAGHGAIWMSTAGLDLHFGSGGTPSGITTKLNVGGNFDCYLNALKPGGGPWGDSSDARIKTVLGSYEHGLAEIKQLNPIRYEFKGNYSASLPEEGGVAVHALALKKEFIGVIAQEIEVPLPETVTLATGYIDGQKVDDVRILDTNAILFALVNAVKELSARIEQLEAR